MTNINDFIKKNRTQFEELEAGGIEHDFCPYDAILEAARSIPAIDEVVPADDKGINYIVRIGERETRLGFLNQSTLSNVGYSRMRLEDAVELIKRGAC